MKLHNIILTILFTLSTPLSCQGQTDTTTPPPTTAVTADSMAPVELKPLDHTVEVGNSKPAAFKNTKANKITRSYKLDAFFDTLTALKRPCRIVHIGDSHVRGHSYTPETRKVLENAWGSQATKPQNIDYHTTAIATETGLPGLVYHAMGKNGATCAHFSTDDYISKVKELKPDLIIISFGTNECHVKNYDTTAHKQELGKLVRRLTEACGNATIMLTTPGGAYFSYKSSYEKMVKQKNGKSVTKKMYKYTYKQNQHTPTCVKVITDYAKRKDFALWDMYAICGGKTNSTTNWYDNKLMKADHVHYTHNGYKVQGDLLAEAILNAYNDYIKRRQDGTTTPATAPASVDNKQKPAAKKPAPAKPRAKAKAPAKPAPTPKADTNGVKTEVKKPAPKPAPKPAAKPAPQKKATPKPANTGNAAPAKPVSASPAKPAAPKPASPKATAPKPATPKPAPKPATPKQPASTSAKQPAAEATPTTNTTNTTQKN